MRYFAITFNCRFENYIQWFENPDFHLTTVTKQLRKNVNIKYLIIALNLLQLNGEKNSLMLSFKQFGKKPQPAPYSYK